VNAVQAFLVYVHHLNQDWDTAAFLNITSGRSSSSAAQGDFAFAPNATASALAPKKSSLPLYSSPGEGRKLVSHSFIRVEAVLRNVPSPPDVFLSTGHGIGSFLGTSCESQWAVVRGLPDTVEGMVFDSDVTLEPDRDATGLSSHVSHGSFETTESLFTDGDLACFETVAFRVGAGLVS